MYLYKDGFLHFSGLRQKQKEDKVDFSNDQEDNILFPRKKKNPFDELSLSTTFYNPSDNT